ncbi:MAG: ATPase domain-containing protein, partial [Nitrososphaerales archaeon]
MSEERVATGIHGFDEVIEGGFPKGSLILLAGAPGTGKTSFASRFVCYGATDAGDNPIYVSFTESREQFIENQMKHFGHDCKCLAEERCRFLDFTAVKKEGVPLILEEILKAVRDSKAKRLVIDSFSAMTQALEEKIETRIIVHTVLSKIVRQMGCTTLLIMEVPTGTDSIGEGVEEFVADGVIILRRGEMDGRLIRDIEISKMRDTRFPQHKYIISLETFLPFDLKTVKRRFKPIPEEADYFSTGNRHLDTVLRGGYRKGSIVLIEIDSKISFEQLGLLILPTIANFLSQGRGLMLIPPSGHDSEYISKMLIEDYEIPVESINDLFRGLQFTVGDTGLKYVVNVGGKSDEEDAKIWVANETNLVNRTGKTPLHVVGLDTLEAIHGAEAVVKRTMMFSTAVKARGGLSIVVCPPGLKEVKQRAANVADIHLKVM